MRLPELSVNHSVPSGASAIVIGPLFAFGSACSVTLPSVRRFPSAEVNQRCSAQATVVSATSVAA